MPSSPDGYCHKGFALFQLQDYAGAVSQPPASGFQSAAHCDKTEWATDSVLLRVSALKSYIQLTLLTGRCVFGCTAGTCIQ